MVATPVRAFASFHVVVGVVVGGVFVSVGCGESPFGRHCRLIEKRGDGLHYHVCRRFQLRVLSNELVYASSSCCALSER